MNWRAIPASVFNQLPPERQQQFKDAQTEKVLKDYHQGQDFKEMGETDLVSDFLANPDLLTPANVDQARPNLANTTYLRLMGKATELETNPRGVVEAQGVNDSIKFYANQAGIKSPDDGKSSQADKQNYTDLTFKVQQDIDAIKTANHGKATADQVNKAIQNELIQRTITQPRSLWNPLSLVSPNSSTQMRNFQLRVAPGSDGKMHYADATGKDLGVVQ
jgi:hypothetical protein